MLSPSARLIGSGCILLSASAIFWWWRSQREIPAGPKPLELRSFIVGEIAKETTLENVQNLARLGDTMYAYTSVVSGPAKRTGYGYLRLFVPALGRVRKILVEVDAANRVAVVQALRQTVRESTSNFADALSEHRQRYAAAKAGGPRYSETDDNRSRYSEYISNGPAAAYLLAMLNAGDALPYLLEAYLSPRQKPMDDAFLFYTMHLLMLRHSADGLSPQAAAALAAYQAAAKSVPMLETKSGAAWNADFDEWDVNTRFSGGRSLVRAGQSVDIAYYPASLVKMEFGLLGPAEPLLPFKPLVDRIETFVRLAYPRADQELDR